MTIRSSTPTVAISGPSLRRYEPRVFSARVSPISTFWSASRSASSHSALQAPTSLQAKVEGTTAARLVRSMTA